MIVDLHVNFLACNKNLSTKGLIKIKTEYYEKLQINVELKTEGRNDKRINIVDVLKPADDVIEKHNRERERQRAFSGENNFLIDANCRWMLTKFFVHHNTNCKGNNVQLLVQWFNTCSCFQESLQNPKCFKINKISQPTLKIVGVTQV